MRSAVVWTGLILVGLAYHNGAHAKRDDALLRQDRGLAGLVGDSRPFLQHDVAASHLGAAGVFVGKAHLMPRTVWTPRSLGNFAGPVLAYRLRRDP